MFRVLIADDEPAVLRFLNQMIPWNELNFTVCAECKDGNEALEKMRTLLPEVVISDIRMPGLSGLELARYNYEELENQCRFIILSGYDEFAYAQAAIRYQVHNYFLKPLEIVNLIAELETLNTSLIEEKKKQISREQFYLQKEYCNHVISMMQVLEEADHDSVKNEVDQFFDWIIQHISQSEDFSQYFNLLLFYLQELLNKYNINQSKLELNLLDLKNRRILKNQLEVIFLKIVEELQQLTINLSKTNETLNQIKDYIEDHYQDNLSLRKIASCYYINSVYLGQIFKNRFGVYFNDYLQVIRMEKAKKLLLNTTLKISSIAYQVGYKDKNYFSVKFTEYTNLKPTDYRRVYSMSTK